MSFKCEMGVEIPSDGRCPDCGADDNQNCGKWVTWAEEEVEKVPALTEENERLKAEVRHLRRSVQVIRQATAYDGSRVEGVTWAKGAQPVHDFCLQTLEWVPTQKPLFPETGENDET